VIINDVFFGLFSLIGRGFFDRELATTRSGGEINNLAARISPGAVFDVEGESLGGGGAGDVGVHPFLSKAGIGRNVHEEFVKSIARPLVDLDGKGAAIWEDHVLLDRFTQALPGEGIEEGEDIVVPGVEASGVAEIDRVLEDVERGGGKLRVACAHVLPEEGNADNFPFIGLGVDDALDAIPILHLLLFGDGGGFMVFVELVFGEDGIDVGPGHFAKDEGLGDAVGGDWFARLEGGFTIEGHVGLGLGVAGEVHDFLQGCGIAFGAEIDEEAKAGYRRI
jgi:hypothetical protein